jgi:hypothetical protein
MGALRAWGAATAVGCLFTACGGSPGESTGNCRRYATRLDENGSVWTCAFEAGRLSLECSIGSTRRSWAYASVGEFVQEAGIPNRILARERRSQSGGPFLVSSASTVTTYRFDPNGRLIERIRTGSNFLGGAVLDTVTYTRWDASGRPVAGEITAAGRVETVSITYDDVRRSATASNGELVVRDVHGNIVQEVEFGGSGGRLRDFVVEGMAEVCTP